MHTRRLVKSGASSYTISLPKEWLQKNKLERGALVYIKEKSATELSIYPEPSEGPIKQKEITINVDNKKIGTTEREITSAYVNNYNTILILGNSLIDKTKEIRRILHNFTALEITEQSSSKIIAKDLLNLKEISIETTIRRMDMIIRSMIQDLKNIENKNISENIHFRDFDVNKLYFLLYRLIKGALGDPVLASHFSLNSSKALSVWNITTNLENIADCCKNISQNLAEIGKKFNLKELEEVYNDIERSYLDVMKAYHKTDKKLADDVASNRTNIVNQCILFSEKNNKFNILTICENLKEMENLICNIARLVIDD
ncbi:MAG: phosphate uptake regulator PhoU [Nanoarchaeota archaeon]|nr:phosphate uptake regulator PhoU [Nanoarchaeota archaeon]